MNPRHWARLNVGFGHRGVAGHPATSVLVALLYCEATGVAPTLRELADRTGQPVSQVHKHLIRLRTDKLVTWSEGRARTLVSTVAVVIPKVRGTVPP